MNTPQTSQSRCLHQPCSGLGDRLRYIREKRGMTQLDLAKRTGLKPTAISHFETESRRPCLANLILLCRHLRVTADYLLDL